MSDYERFPRNLEIDESLTGAQSEVVPSNNVPTETTTDLYAQRPSLLQLADTIHPPSDPVVRFVRNVEQ